MFQARPAHIMFPLLDHYILAQSQLARDHYTLCCHYIYRKTRYITMSTFLLIYEETILPLDGWVAHVYPCERQGLWVDNVHNVTLFGHISYTTDLNTFLLICNTNK